MGALVVLDVVGLLDARPGVTCVRSFRRRRRASIELRPLWYPLHRQPVFTECEAFRVEHADALHARGLSLPCSVGITARGARASRGVPNEPAPLMRRMVRVLAHLMYVKR
jgi:hypothetical protein